MSMNKSVQFLALGLSGIAIVSATLVLTGSLRGRTLRKTSSSRGEMLGVLAASVKTLTVAKTLPERNVALPGVPADFKQYVKIDCIGNLLHVDATTLIQHTRPDDGHVWSVRVVDAADPETVLFNGFFGFASAERNTEMTSKLNEVIDLPLDGGDYLVLVDFHRVPSTPGMDVFLDQKAFGIYNLSGGRADITVER